MAIAVVVVYTATYGRACRDLLYFRLVQDLGATATLSVTFLIPVFGVLWGHVFLDETISWHTLFGAAIVIAGTMLVTGFRITALFTPAKETQ